MNLCECGCGQKVTKKRNRYVKGHNKLSENHKQKIREANSKRIWSEESKRKISKANRGHKHSEETKKKIGLAHKGKVISEEARKKISDSLKGKNKGHNNPNFKSGKRFILTHHRQHKKQECIFGCENTKRYELHHEPEIEGEILIWEGKLINLCVSCHKKIHTNSLKLPDNVGILWTKKDTERILKGD